MRVSIMITTCNRLEELKRTIETLRQLDPTPDEILITLDGCTTDVVEAVEIAVSITEG